MGVEMTRQHKTMATYYIAVCLSFLITISWLWELTSMRDQQDFDVLTLDGPQTLVPLVLWLIKFFLVYLHLISLYFFFFF